MWRSAYDAFFPSNTWCATPLISAIFVLAVIFCPIGIALIIITKRWAINLNKLKPVLQKSVKIFIGIMLFSMVGNLFLVVAFYFDALN